MRVTNSIDLEIGRRLRQARLVEFLTQDGLAQKIHISFQQVQKYENGTNRVSASRLWSIANVLGVPITYFYDGLEPAAGVDRDAKPEVSLPDRTIRVAHLLHEMPDGPIKDSVFDVIKSIIKQANPDAASTDTDPPSNAL